MLLKSLVKIYRQKRGWRQVDLAERLKVSQNYVSKIELGFSIPRSRDFREKLAKALNCPITKMEESFALTKLSDDEIAALYRDFEHRTRQRDLAALLKPEQIELVERFGKLSKVSQKEFIGYLGYLESRENGKIE